MRQASGQSSHNPLLLIIVVGLVLMLGVILASENLNAMLPTNTPVMASSPTPAPTPAPTITNQTPAPTSAPTGNSLDPMSSILNSPKNFRVVPKDIKPAQAVIENKTIKFLMGF